MYELVAALLVVLIAAHYFRFITLPQMGEMMEGRQRDSMFGVTDPTLLIPKKVPYEYTGDVVMP